jgi:hypothetical protein
MMAWETDMFYLKINYIYSMKLLLAITFILAVISTGLFAQTNYGFGEGIITKKDGTSIKCYVELAVTYYSRVAYKFSQDGKEISLKANEIKSIQTPYKYVESITLDNTERLMGMVSDGQVRLFNHVTINSGRKEKGKGGTFDFYAPPTIVYAIKKDENYHELNKESFKTKLSELLNDQPSIVEKISSTEFKFEEIEKIINEYNRKVISRKRQIIAKVVDSETRKPIKEVKVTIKGTEVMMQTNFLGFIQIEIDAIDTLLIEHPEYEMGKLKVPEVDSFLITLTRMRLKMELDK